MKADEGKTLGEELSILALQWFFDALLPTLLLYVLHTLTRVLADWVDGDVGPNAEAPSTGAHGSGPVELS